MRESSRGRSPRSKLFQERTFEKNKFGTVVHALWPDKPALNLAQRMGISERGARYLIDGKRKVNGKAIAVILSEIM